MFSIYSIQKNLVNPVYFIIAGNTDYNAASAAAGARSTETSKGET